MSARPPVSTCKVSTYVHQRRVEFSETDMAGIVHFSNFFRYMEAAEHDFFRSLGFTLHSQEEGRMSGWARVSAHCDYQAPLRYGDLVDIALTVTAKRTSSLAFELRFLLRERDGQAVDNSPQVALGQLTTVHVTRDPADSRMRAAPIPAAIDRVIEAAPVSSSSPLEDER